MSIIASIISMLALNSVNFQHTTHTSSEKEMEGLCKALKMCRVLGAFRSGYYICGKNSKSDRQRGNERLLVYIRDAFEKGCGKCGSPKVTVELQANGIECSRKRLAHLMKSHGIKAKTKRRFKATRKSKHDFLVADNLLNQRISTEVANQVWVSDITFIGRERVGFI